MQIDKIYFDMDGVLADFDKGLIELCQIEPVEQGKRTKAEKQAVWKVVRKAGHFYGRLDPLPGALEMFRSIHEEYGDKVEILTGYPASVPESPADKKNWAAEYLGADIVVHTVYRKDKPQYCSGPSCILIDDYTSNIQEWEEAGGTGVLHTSCANTLEQIKKLSEK